MTEAIILIVGLAAGVLVGWLWAGLRHTRLLQEERERRVAAETRLQDMEQSAEAQRSLLEEARQQLADTFKALSGDALRDNSQAFVDRAKQALEPLGEALRRYEEHLREIERSRQQAYGSLEAQVNSLLSAEQQLQRATADLVSALRRPQVRGRWGEITLQRVVELAGMSEYCDYEQQVTGSGDGGRLRPDMVIRLPAGREIVVDAKAPLDAYLSAVEAEDEEVRRKRLEDHARQLRAHMSALAQKSYWEQFTAAPEFVVMFVPGESFLAAACAVDHSLVEEGLRRRVLLTSPVTLMGVLCAVAHSWRQQRLAQNAEQISALGRQFYDRIRTFVASFDDVGRHLGRAAEAFNRAAGSLESRLLPSARRFRDLGAASGEEIEAPGAIEAAPRDLRSLAQSDDRE